MAKRLLSLVFGFVLILAASAESYTVITKNGKTMTGTLVSENDSLIVFKDDHGLQFSFKKSSLDLDKMKVANEPPAPAVPVAAQPAANPKKEAKVYGQNDLDTLRNKYGDLSPGQLTIDGEMSPDSYYKTLQGGISEANDLLSALKSLALDITATWEAAISTGKSGHQELSDFMTAGAGFGALTDATNRINGLKKVRDQLMKPPKGYEAVPKNFSIMVDSLGNVANLMSTYNSITDGVYFRTNIDRMTLAVTRALAPLQDVKEIEEPEPQLEATPEPTPPAKEEKTEPEPQKPPEITNQNPPTPPSSQR
jgi:hypothetical protein